MDNGIATFFSWQFILFALGISVIMFFLRTILEYIYPNIDKMKFWSELCLPLLPPIIGAVLSYFATKYAYPDGLNSLSGRILFGSVSGLLSGLVFKVVKGMLKDKVQSFITSQQPQPNVSSQVIPFSADNK